MSRFERTVVLIHCDSGARGDAGELVRKSLRIPDVDRRFSWHGPELLSVRLEHSLPKSAAHGLRRLPGVRQVDLLSSSSGLVMRRAGQADSVVVLPGGRKLGGGNLAVFAGPCSVESRSQVCEIAARVKAAGANVLRGGAFKPRTSPYSFRGLGERALEFLAAAREKTGLPVATEILDTTGLDLVAEYADILQIGSRNMQNFELLFRAGSHPSAKPILLKRSFGATIEEFMLAAEYVLLGRAAAGHRVPGLLLCERGIRTFDSLTRFIMDVAAIPILRERTHLPIIADPSHSAGTQSLVAPLARAAVAAGADGVIVEVHSNPSKAWSDAEQTLTPGAFRSLVKDLRRLHALKLDRS